MWWSGTHWDAFPLVVADEDAKTFCEQTPEVTQEECAEWAVERGALRVLLGHETLDGTEYTHKEAALGEARDVILLAHTVQNNGGEFTSFGDDSFERETTSSIADSPTNQGIFPRLVRKLIAEGSATHDFHFKAFQHVKGRLGTKSHDSGEQIWDLLDSSTSDLNPRNVHDSLEVIAGTKATKHVGWITSAPLDSWGDFVEAYDVASDSLRSTTTNIGTILNGHVFYEVISTERATGESHSLWAVRLLADPVRRDVRRNTYREMTFHLI